MSAERVIAYIDGFNFYYGLRDAKLRSSRWLDLPTMCQSLLQQGQNLELVRYFTTRVRNDPQREAPVNVHRCAARSGGIEIDFGHFLSKNRECYKCGHKWQQSEEKKTDVNIAVRLLTDVYDDRFDTAIVISGDSDLVPPIKSVRGRFRGKHVIVAFPRNEPRTKLKAAANAAFTISNKTIRSSRLPNPV